MKRKKLIVIVTVFSLLIGLRLMSPTLARYVSEYSGYDAALIARWDFKVGPDADSLTNDQHYIFDLFEGVVLKPGDAGQKSFVVSSGKSDVAIDYKVYMNADVLEIDAINNVYLPLTFRINSSGQEEWIIPKDLGQNEFDSERYFLIQQGQFAAGQEAQATIQIDWRWDTPSYKGETTDEAYNKMVSDAIGELETEIDGNITFKVEGWQVEPVGN